MKLRKYMFFGELLISRIVLPGKCTLQRPKNLSPIEVARDQQHPNKTSLHSCDCHTLETIAWIRIPKILCYYTSRVRFCRTPSNAFSPIHTDDTPFVERETPIILERESSLRFSRRGREKECVLDLIQSEGNSTLRV